MLNLADPVALVEGVGKKYQQKLANRGILTVGDLLYHFPFRYDDFSAFKKIDQINLDESVTVQGRIVSVKTTPTRRRNLVLTEAYLVDDTGQIKIVWYNAPAVLKPLRVGKAVRISGKTKLDRQSEMFFSHPNIEFIPLSALQREQAETVVNLDEESMATGFNTGILAPIYHEIGNLKTFWFRRIIKNLLSQVNIVEFIPQDILHSQKLPGREWALHAIHFPNSAEEVELAKKRFAFEKIFLLQLKFLLLKQEQEGRKAPAIPFNEEFIKNFVQSLPFQLTAAQKKCAWQIIKDLEKNKPMNRLLEGDVGTGKTVVSALAILSVMNQLYQAALLAPTEVLALQHYRELRRFYKQFDFKVALLTRSETRCGYVNAGDKKISKRKLLEQLSRGEIDLLIGTHAIIQDAVNFKNLALLVIDEQHRFGVRQRAHLQQQALRAKRPDKKIPHLLSMTATPIPRTLSLTIFGNLDLSILDEFPAGRKKIITKVVPAENYQQVYNFVQTELQKGRQAFIICPLVQETSKMAEVKAAVEEYQRLQERVFPNFKLGLLHGKMKPKEKNEIMKRFKEKELDILVSTSVVEVGVDVPNANIMIIEGAERFGLAQLHQFRGRVGRGEHQSYCFLFTSPQVQTGTERLRTLEETNDGFKIAEADLKLRGPGQFMGTAQSGLPDIAMESLADVRVIEQARQEAQRVLAADPKLKKLAALRAEVEKLENVVHNE